MPTPNTTTHRKVHGLGWIKRGTQQEKIYLQNKARREQKALQEKEIRAGRGRPTTLAERQAVGRPAGRGKGAVRRATGTGKTGLKKKTGTGKGAVRRKTGTGKGGMKKKK